MGFRVGAPVRVPMNARAGDYRGREGVITRGLGREHPSILGGSQQLWEVEFVKFNATGAPKVERVAMWESHIEEVRS